MDWLSDKTNSPRIVAEAVADCRLRVSGEIPTQTCGVVARAVEHYALQPQPSGQGAQVERQCCQALFIQARRFHMQRMHGQTAMGAFGAQIQPRRQTLAMQKRQYVVAI